MIVNLTNVSVYYYFYNIPLNYNSRKFFEFKISLIEKLNKISVTFSQPFRRYCLNQVNLILFSNLRNFI